MAGGATGPLVLFAVGRRPSSRVSSRAKLASMRLTQELPAPPTTDI